MTNEGTKVLDKNVTDNPEIGRFVAAGGVSTNVHVAGRGAPVLLVHGSGPGVSAWANWRGLIPVLSRDRMVIAPDMVGFGYTERPAGVRYELPIWVDQMSGLLDSLGLDQVDLVGNSFGGAVSLAFAVKHPGRVRRLVLMGSAGVAFELTPGLDAVWGYQPSVENMRRMMAYFVYDRGVLSADLATLRYQASIQPGFQESFSSMFPAPRQRSVEALATSEDAIRGLPHQTLLIHGRDDEVVPLQTSLRLNQLIQRSDLHVFGRCGHWVQIEKAVDFARLVSGFLAGNDA